MRDYLEREIRARGGRPVPYSVLTERARAAADRWFNLRPVPVSRRPGPDRG